MREQGSLFAVLEEPRAPPPPKPVFKKREALQWHKVKHPYGVPDRRGKRAYEKLQEELRKLPALYQDRFDALVVNLPEATGNQLLKCLRMFMAFDNADLMDFDESRGRL